MAQEFAPVYDRFEADITELVGEQAELRAAGEPMASAVFWDRASDRFEAVLVAKTGARRAAREGQ